MPCRYLLVVPSVLTQMVGLLPVDPRVLIKSAPSVIEIKLDVTVGELSLFVARSC